MYTSHLEPTVVEKAGAFFLYAMPCVAALIAVLVFVHAMYETRQRYLPELESVDSEPTQP